MMVTSRDVGALKAATMVSPLDRAVAILLYQIETVTPACGDSLELQNSRALIHVLEDVSLMPVTAPSSPFVLASF